MVRHRCILILLLAGCGRIDYDPLAEDAADASADDAGGTPLSCATGFPGQVLCEDFEGDLGQWDFLGGDAFISQTEAHAGSSSLAVPVESSASFIQTTLPTPIDSGTHYLRAYLFVPSNVDINGAVVLMELPGSEKISLDIHSSGGLQWVTATAPVQPVSEGALARDRWLCLQAEILFEDVGGHAIASVDGNVFLEHLDADTRGPAPFTRLAIGQRVPLAIAGPTDIFVDDIVFGTEPIPCD